MAFEVVKYEAESGTIHPLRLDDARASVAGPAPAADIDSGAATVKISKSRGQFGIRPRGVRLVRTVGTAPNQFKKYTFLPCLTPARYNALTRGTDVTIGGTSWEVSKQVPEDAD